MKTPDENKCGMECIRTNTERICVKPENGQCPRCEQLVEEALGHIKQIESTVSQVSKALCGKENATICEVLDAISQVKSRLAQVERERDVALKEWKRTKMDSEGMCWTCKHGHITDIGSCRCVSPFPCDDGEEWEWRGVCEKNTGVTLAEAKRK